MRKGKVKAKIAGLEFEFDPQDLKVALEKVLKENLKREKALFSPSGQQGSH